jgi:hypothetical protein
VVTSDSASRSEGANECWHGLHAWLLLLLLLLLVF